MQKLSLTMLIVLILCSSNSFLAQDMDSEEAQKAWQEYMTPGDMHFMLAKMAGEWNAKVSMWNDPAGEPMVSEGTVSSEMILGGRYLQSKHTGTYMSMPMNGLAIEAYDNSRKKFVNTWIDNFGTGIMVSEGDYNPDTKEMVYHGKMTDPMGGGEIETKQVMKMIDDNNAIFEMFIMMGGQEVKSMEMIYTRK